MRKNEMGMLCMWYEHACLSTYYGMACKDRFGPSQLVIAHVQPPETDIKISETAVFTVSKGPDSGLQKTI